MNKKKTFNKILVVVAHPDDEVLGCGGTLAKMTGEGDTACCLFMGRGKSSRMRSGQKKKLKKEQGVLKKEAKEAAKILGIDKIFFEDFPDQRYDTVPFLNLVKSIEKIKNLVEPDIIFMHHVGDLNLDHQLTARAVLTAFRPLPGETAKAVYSFEIPSSTEWGPREVNKIFLPNVFVDVAASFAKKIKAVNAYASESRAYPHPRSAKGVELIAKRWGVAVGVKKAEAFLLIREIK